MGKKADLTADCGHYGKGKVQEGATVRTVCLRCRTTLAVEYTDRLT